MSVTMLYECVRGVVACYTSLKTGLNKIYTSLKTAFAKLVCFIRCLTK